MSAQRHKSREESASPAATRPPDELVRELEQARRAARVLDLSLLERSSDEELLQGLLGLFVEAAGADVAVLRLREGDRLRSRAAVGLAAEVVAGFSTEVGEALPLTDAPLTKDGGHGTDSSIRFVAVAADGAADGCAASEALRQGGVQSLCRVPLLEPKAEGEALVGVVYLGAREPRELSAEETQLLGLLAPRAAAAIARCVDHAALQAGIHSRDEVLSVVAHDLRNPINVIGLAAHALLRRLTDSSARRPLERIGRAVHRCDRLVQDLLEISAIERGRFSIEPQTVVTADTILAALESQQTVAAEASIIIAADISPDLPPLEADEERILEVLENLIGNAVKFSSPGGTVTVGANGSDGGREIRFWVKDDGPGIPPDQVPHLFDRFWQARKKDRRGTGLGLTICKAIVEAHGGRIWADTKVGAGTTLCFTLPAKARVPSPGAAEPATLLLVDDRPENLVALTAILERPGYRLVTAASGEEALRLALRERFSVALIDVAMPTMSGLEVAVHLKELERCRDIPIIFITAFGDDPEEIHRAYSAGGADYLVKPLNAEIVRKKVAVFVDLSRRRQAHARRKEDRS